MEEELKRQNESLRRELQELMDRFARIEAHSEVLQNLYVASHRLHATLDPDEVLATIKEIIVNLVGAEVFGIWLLDGDGRMSLFAHEGISDSALTAREQELLATDPWFAAPGAPPPLAVVPLRIEQRGVGVLVVRKLLAHKPSLGELDQEILRLLSGQAATALTSARLYTEKSRKLDTMKAFLDFMKAKG